MGLKWFTGISVNNTPMREIGWVWVLLVFLVWSIIVSIKNLWNDFFNHPFERKPHKDDSQTHDH